jgi:hypothetical protein
MATRNGSEMLGLNMAATALGRGVHHSGRFHVAYHAVAGPSGGVRWYKKQARDSAGGTTYVRWVTTDPTQPYPGAPPIGGPLVEETILSSWIVVGG